MISDPIADMLTRLRNAGTAGHGSVTLPTSRVKVALARLLTDEGFVAGYDTSGDGPHATLTVTLKPSGPNGRALNGLRRVSKPGLRVYAGAAEIPQVLGGLGVSIISTSRGLLTGQAARRAGVGGEVVAQVW